VTLALQPTAIIAALESLAAGASPSADIRRLQGRTEYRLRVGRWRVIFEWTQDLLVGERIVDQKDAYR
jgi:hypothetical protein